MARRHLHRVSGLTAAAGLVLGLLAAVATPPAGAATQAPGGPGTLSRFDLARKDCVGTAQNSTSKVWFTVADGVLSDVYEPTIDNTNVHTLQYVVTDGRTFTDLQSRDLTYTVAADPSGMECRPLMWSDLAPLRMPVGDGLGGPLRVLVGVTLGASVRSTERHRQIGTRNPDAVITPRIDGHVILGRHVAVYALRTGAARLVVMMRRHVEFFG